MRVFGLLPALAGTVLLLVSAPVAAAETPQAPAVAQPSARSLELSRRYVAAAHLETTVNRAMAVMRPAMLSQLDTSLSKLSDQKRATVRRIMTETLDEYTKDSVAKMQARMPLILAQTFTDAELEGMVTFYESPIGQSVVDKMPAMMERMMPMVMEDMPKVRTKMLVRLCEAFPGECKGSARPRPSAS